ncbi:Qat anti-phage system QueC-like protein QatC [Pontibacter sp. H249]|uniref:Qat anti-phage system QueC-like protein QatC n=1 Tax=Pontibacter sp. H249 TaxID=3133420 RepID=UPI0030C21D7A
MQVAILFDKINRPSKKAEARHEFTLNTKVGSKEYKGKLVVDLETLVANTGDSTSLNFDLFLISCYAYGVDRFIKREIYSFDGWSRKIEVDFPVINVQVWESKKAALEKILSFISGDIWDISFSPSSLSFDNTYKQAAFLGKIDQVNLLSGGLDSLIGAIDSLEQPKQVLFVSQYDNDFKGPHQEQEKLFNALKDEYKNAFHIPSVLVTLQGSDLSVRESTLRTRSLMFISLGLYFASNISKDVNLLVPENGSISLNFPLNSSRRTACSTRTTHPNLMRLTSELLSELNITNTIFNDYSFKTKGEMVNNCRNIVFLKNMITRTNSCGKRGYNNNWEEPDIRIAHHCGRCMPCVYRKASLLKIEPTAGYYGNRLSSTINSNKIRSQDLKACKAFLDTPLTDEEISRELVSNGLVDFENLNKYVDLVKRTRAEVDTLFKHEGI